MKTTKKITKLDVKNRHENYLYLKFGASYPATKN